MAPPDQGRHEQQVPIRAAAPRVPIATDDATTQAAVRICAAVQALALGLLDELEVRLAAHAALDMCERAQDLLGEEP